MHAFADEPTANLDPILRAKLWAHLGEMSQEVRALLVRMPSNDEAEQCDRVGLVYGGALIRHMAARLRVRLTGHGDRSP